jgi:hypothetical protein
LGPRRQYREYFPGQDTSRPVLSEYAPLSPKPCAMTYMVVESMFCVNYPRLKLVERSTAEVDAYRSMYPLSSATRPPPPPPPRKRRSLTDKIVDLFGSNKSKKSTEIPKITEIGPCANWAKLMITMDIPTEIKNIKVEWNQVTFVIDHPPSHSNINLIFLIVDGYTNGWNGIAQNLLSHNRCLHPRPATTSKSS